MKRARELLCAPACSARGLALWAGRLGLLPLLLHLLGAREQVSVLSGTLGSPLGMGLGLAYVVSWFAAVLLGPPLLLAAGALGLWGATAPALCAPSPRGRGVAGRR